MSAFPGQAADAKASPTGFWSLLDGCLTSLELPATSGVSGKPALASQRPACAAKRSQDDLAVPVAVLVQTSPMLPAAAGGTVAADDPGVEADNPETNSPADSAAAVAVPPPQAGTDASIGEQMAPIPELAFAARLIVATPEPVSAALRLGTFGRPDLSGQLPAALEPDNRQSGNARAPLTVAVSPSKAPDKVGETSSAVPPPDMPAEDSAVRDSSLGPQEMHSAVGDSSTRLEPAGSDMRDNSATGSGSEIRDVAAANQTGPDAPGNFPVTDGSEMSASSADAYNSPDTQERSNTPANSQSAARTPATTASPASSLRASPDDARPAALRGPDAPAAVAAVKSTAFYPGHADNGPGAQAGSPPDTNTASAAAAPSLAEGEMSPPAPTAASPATPQSSPAPPAEPQAETASPVSHQVAWHLEDGNVDIRMAERAGEIRVTVHTTDRDLASSLRADLPDLVGKLRESGFQAEAWRPTAGSQTPGDRRGDPEGRSAQQDSPDTRKDGRRQQNSQQQKNSARWAGEWQSRLAPAQEPKL